MFVGLNILFTSINLLLLCTWLILIEIMFIYNFTYGDFIQIVDDDYDFEKPYEYFLIKVRFRLVYSWKVLFNHKEPIWYSSDLDFHKLIINNDLYLISSL